MATGGSAALCDLQRDSFTTDSAGDTCQRVCATDALPVTFSAGTPFNEDAQDTTTAGSTKTILTTTVPGGVTTRKLVSVQVSCNLPARFDILVGASIVGSMRTHPGNPNAKFDFDERPVGTGVTIKVDVTQRAGIPSTDVEAYLQARDF